MGWADGTVETAKAYSDTAFDVVEVTVLEKE